ncbi:MAG: type II/IV secretion system ATPase subunit [DPANN group archaeon]|nr:type II/IV secretion system ATPase subunit [DPANN group archaeon]
MAQDELEGVLEEVTEGKQKKKKPVKAEAVKLGTETPSGQPEATEVELKKPKVVEFPHIEERLTETKKPVASAVVGMPSGMMEIPEEAKEAKISTEWSAQETKDVNLRYPLIEPYAYANIRWNDDTEEVIYHLIEPPLTKHEKELKEKITTLMMDLLDINLTAIKDVATVKNYLKDKLTEIINEYEIQVSDSEYNKITYYLYRDFLGLGKIEPVMQDLDIEDISCDGKGIPLYLFHRKFGSIKTNLSFDTDADLNSFIIKLVQRSGKHISVSEPLVDAALPDGSRLQATYSTEGDISTRGSTFTIRKFTKDPLTIIDLMNFGTIPSTMAAYLWMAIEYKNSILVSGGTATGKTSAMNALSMFLTPELKIISIEDTAELRLPHQHWIAKIARSGYGPPTITGERRGEVSMYELLRAALRERPDEIIVGEVRGKEAYVLFQAMATGHAGLATIHGESMEGVVNRLITPPINLSAGLLQQLNIVMILQHAKINKIDVRRVKEVIEITGVELESKSPIVNRLFKWVPAGDYYQFSSDRSYILNKIREDKGVPEKSIWEEVNRRKDALEWMKNNNIRYYKDVGEILEAYHRNPEEVLKKVYGLGKYGKSNIR